MERSHGEEGFEGKCRKDKGHDLWYRPGPLAEFRCHTGEATTASTSIAANFGCIRNATGYNDWHQMILNIGVHITWKMTILLTTE